VTYPLVTHEDVLEVGQRIAGLVQRTPLLQTEVDGTRVWLKCECLQTGGAFKLRGATNRLLQLSQEERERGVVAFSSGNHARGVAIAARRLGIRAIIVMPADAPQVKVEGTRSEGAEIIFYDRRTESREAIAAKISKETGATVVPSFDDRAIVAGQGTAGLEIAEDLPDVGTVLVPVGGGGLSAGVATAVKLLVPTARVIAVEPVGAAKLTRARAAGAPVRLESTGGMADGLLATQIGTIPFAHHAAYIDEVVTIEDAELAPAMRYLLDRLKIVAEPSGAITLAALQCGRVKPRGATVAVLSGGNIEFDGLQEVLAHG